MVRENFRYRRISRRAIASTRGRSTPGSIPPPPILAQTGHSYVPYKYCINGPAVKLTAVYFYERWHGKVYFRIGPLENRRRGDVLYEIPLAPRLSRSRAIFHSNAIRQVELWFISFEVFTLKRLVCLGVENSRRLDNSLLSKARVSYNQNKFFRVKSDLLQSKQTKYIFF